MIKAQQTFHLFVESFAVEPATPAGGKPAGTARRGSSGSNGHSLPYPALEVAGEGKSYLSIDAAGLPHVSQEQPAGEQPSITLETFRYDHRPYLSAVVAPQANVRVNGLCPPPLGILRPRDVIEIDSEHALHVSVFTRPYLGRPPEESVGKECPVCLTPITATSTVYVCPFCQRALHAGKLPAGGAADPEQNQQPAQSSETETTTLDDQSGREQEAGPDPAEDELECVRLSSTCPGCEHPIVLSEGYAYVPEV